MSKHSKRLFLAMAAGSMLAFGTAYAEDNAVVEPGHPRVNEVNQRLENQQQRIQNGIEQGTVTPGEAKRLESSEGKIQQKEAVDMAKHDGHLTKLEQRQLNRQENRVSARIHHARHNVTPEKTTAQ
jgi:CRISPR/Cas system-associated endoribonuclease Cas2